MYLSIEDFEILTQSIVKTEISNNIDKNPQDYVLKAKNKELPNSLIATQIKYLQKAKTKLPSYFDARCIIPSLSFEQSSSEITAKLKNYTGKKCLDLTGGLGVDSFYLSKNFEQITVLEMNTSLSYILKYNFELLGVKNATILNTNAEDFLLSNSEKFDLIFVDPARRNQDNQKTFLFEDCSPNIFEIFDNISKITKKLVIKASPLFDNNAAIKNFNFLSKLITISIDNECKELLLEFDFDKKTDNIKEEIYLAGKKYNSVWSFDNSNITEFELNNINKKYLLEPDVAFYKARKINNLCKLFKDYKTETSGINGYIFAEQQPINFPGRIFKIDNIIDFNTKKLKTFIKEHNIKKANISKRNFVLNTDEIKKQFKILDGGHIYIFFSENNVFICSAINKEDFQ